MKKTIALSLFVLSACNTGNVQVGAGADGTQPGTTTQGSSNANGQQPGTGPSKSGSKKIFFERVKVSNAVPQHLISIGFESELAKSSSMVFQTPYFGNEAFSSYSPFIPANSEIISLRSVEVGTDALVSTSLDSLDSNQIFTFPREVVDFSLNNNHSEIAWVDETGVVSVSSIPNGQAEQLDTTLLNSTTLLDHIQWSSDDSYLLARADNGAGLLYKTGTAKPTLLAGVYASSFSNDGTQLAYFNSTTKALHVVDLASGKDKVAGTFDSSDIHDLSWNTATSVSYWTTLATGSKELRVFTSAQETTVATLTLPSSVKDGVVCPAWIGNKVYFGNFDSGNYVIEQIDLNAGLKDAKKAVGMQVFAETSADPGEGFVCPKVLK